ncbi:flagellin [Sulfurimonas aquatica]|uniref:Flagellin n=1 Tax=Sulfurimonas aquatica TaxID=2672570 RepID=A0A975GDR3_9BACT|nr:flagellin [Sulfurimonas aquatica]QSZ42996.1 flagellin [Sulfurimonas aquatica]
MAFSINSNISAMRANLQSTLSNQGLNSSLNNLSSGSSVSSAAYDASGLGIANQLSAQVSGMGQAIQNSNESIGMIQIADGAMSGIEENMQRIRTLTLQASNGILNDGDRAIIQKEIDTLLKSSDDIAKQTSYNGINLLDGTGGSNGDGTFVTQSGSDAQSTQNLSINDSSIASLVGTIDITTEAGRSTGLDSIDSALASISDTRADLGASQNSLMASIRNTSLTQINIAAAESNIRDIDFAAESANFSKQNILSQIGSFSQAQANASASNVTRLFS